MILGTQFDSPVGKITIAASEVALLGIWFDAQAHFGSGLKWINGENVVLAQTKPWLKAYFDGARPDPGDLAIDPAGTVFQQAVWDILKEIPYGATVSYGHIAQELRQRGIKASAQAVGGAVGRNPISIVIPCHRVVGSDGSLTGYAGGVDKKQFLIDLEQK